MHPDPLEPGQAFSFVETVYAIECQGVMGTAFIATSRDHYKEWPGRRQVIGSGQRLVVQDEMYLVGDAWYVRTWLPELDKFGKPLGFLQQLGPEVVQTFVPAWSRGHHMPGTCAVKDVGWPEPTPESLMVQVRVLSRWPNGSARGRFEKRNPVCWRACERLAKMTLDQGLPEALQLLQGHVDDPAAALRARGFGV